MGPIESKDRLTKILIPVDGSLHSQKAVLFSACMAKAMKERVKEIFLIHVLGGSHLKEHMEKRDVRAMAMMDGKVLKRLREEHIEKEVKPFLDKEKSRLKEFGVTQPVELLVEDGRPAERIMEVAKDRGISTVVIGRRGLSAMKEFFVGSVTVSLINQPGHPTIYVVSETPMMAGDCPIPRVLVPLDGSSHGQSALDEALVFLEHYGEKVSEVVLLRVIDPARYEERRAQGVIPEEEGRQILEGAREKVLACNIPEDRIDTVMLYGKPADRILDMAMGRNSNIIFMGKRGRSPLKDLVVGNTAMEVIHRLTSAVIAICS